MLRYLLLVSFCCFSISSLKAQFLEVGGGVSTFNYVGDLVPNFNLSNTGPGFSIHQRMNLSNYFSVKWGLAYGKLQGDDSNPVDALGSNRSASFDQSIWELSSTLEYHFLDYKHEHSTIRWTPYAYFGFGILRLNDYAKAEDNFNRLQPIIPFGIGYKHLIGKQFSIAVEFGARKTFFDQLDRISDGIKEGGFYLKDFQYGNPKDNDFYYFFGVSLSFVIFDIPCPFPYVPNRDMLRANFR